MEIVTFTVILNVICVAAIVVALYRFVALRTVGRLAHYLSATFLCFGAAKLARTPVVSDEWVDGWIHSWSGVWNVTDFTAMTLAVWGAVFLVHAAADIFGRPFPTALLWGALTLGTFGMGVSFALSPVPHTPTSFMTQDFELAGWFAVYWIIYLGYLGVSGLILASLAGASAKVFRPGAARPAVLFLAAAGLCGFLYVTHKIVNLAIESLGVFPWYAANAPMISIATLLLTIGTGLVGMMLMFVPAARRRLRRYFTLRAKASQWRVVQAEDPDVALEPALLPSSGPGALWAASRSPVTSHRMLIELSDSMNSQIADRTQAVS